MSYIRPFLKWPGGKYRLLNAIHKILPNGKCLIEPFVGSGAVFLNSSYDRYILNDANADLITLYQILQKEGESFIQQCVRYFTPRHNTEKQYYALRTRFNRSKDPHERSILFLYLNRHGFNGLCRYNLNKKEFNVPFGRYKKPYFPEKEMHHFYEKSQKAMFTTGDFTQALKNAKKGSVVYCDPPYVPLSNTACFTRYHGVGFNMEQHQLLAVVSRKLIAKGIPVLISNHSHETIHTLYRGAEITELEVMRFISCQANNRKSVKEVLALFD